MGLYNAKCIERVLEGEKFKVETVRMTVKQFCDLIGEERMPLVMLPIFQIKGTQKVFTLDNNDTGERMLFRILDNTAANAQIEAQT